MLENPLDPRYGVIAAASAAIGALALKLVDRAFQIRDRRGKDTVDSRRELLDERIELRDRLRAAEDALAEWKEKYFKLLEESAPLIHTRYGRRGRLYALGEPFTSAPARPWSRG